MDKENVIEIKNLSKVYVYKHLWMKKLTTALKDVNLAVKKNEIFGLIGLNGAGKTTLIKILLGLIWKTEGEAYLFSKVVPDTNILQKIGYMPEIPYFLNYLTPDEILNLYSNFYEIPSNQKKDRIRNVLFSVGMDKFHDTRMKNFSKGMLQRIGFAACILNDPELLILDEPTTGLDPLGIISMREFILKMYDHGKTIFFSSHLISEVEKIATRVAILKNGTIEKVYKKEEYFNNLEKIFFNTVKDVKIQDLK